MSRSDSHLVHAFTTSNLKRIPRAFLDLDLLLLFFCFDLLLLDICFLYDFDLLFCFTFSSGFYIFLKINVSSLLCLEETLRLLVSLMDINFFFADLVFIIKEFSF